MEFSWNPTGLFQFLFIQGYGCKNPGDPLIVIFPGVSISNYVFPGGKFAQLAFSGRETDHFFQISSFSKESDRQRISGDLWVRQSFSPGGIGF